MTYGELQEALSRFGLGERATLKQIKARHRLLVKAHHPDQGAGRDGVVIQQVNDAYKVLLAYCESYRFNFSEAEFLEQFPEERLRRQFSGDPVWGGKPE